MSEVSGRGVGMNVVEEAVHSLKGTIEIESELGRGTLFRLKLPISLAIFNGAVVRVNQGRYVVPSSDISEISRIKFSDEVRISSTERAIKIRDEVFQMIDLRTYFGGTSNSRNENVSGVQEGLAADTPVLISRKTGNRAFVVDEVIGIQKIVQKPLGNEIKRRAEFAAGTILGDGSPGVILNLQMIKGAA